MSDFEVHRVPRWAHRVPMLGPSVPGWLNVLLGVGMLAVAGVALVLMLLSRSKATLTPSRLVTPPLMGLGSLVLAVWGWRQARLASRGLDALRVWATARGFVVDGHTVRGQPQGQPFVAHVALRRRSSRITGLLLATTVGDECVIARVPIPETPSQAIPALDGALAAILRQ